MTTAITTDQWTVVYVRGGIINEVIPCKSETIAEREYHRLIIEHGDCLETDLESAPHIREELIEDYKESKEINGKHYLIRMDDHIMCGSFSVVIE